MYSRTQGVLASLFVWNAAQHIHGRIIFFCEPAQMDIRVPIAFGSFMWSFL
jgi:hypothetical protein